jgi:superfamily II RNA helicase
VDRNDLAQKANFQGMVRVLKELHYIDREEMMLLKGRLAREVGDIYVAEVMLAGILERLTPAGLAAVLGGFVNQFKRRKNAPNSKIPAIPLSVRDATDEVIKLVGNIADL